MVVQWEDRFYESVRGHTILCDPREYWGRIMKKQFIGLHQDV